MLNTVHRRPKGIAMYAPLNALSEFCLVCAPGADGPDQHLYLGQARHAAGGELPAVMFDGRLLLQAVADAKRSSGRGGGQPRRGGGRAAAREPDQGLSDFLSSRASLRSVSLKLT